MELNRRKGSSQGSFKSIEPPLFSLTRSPINHWKSENFPWAHRGQWNRGINASNLLRGRLLQWPLYRSRPKWRCNHNKIFKLVSSLIVTLWKWLKIGVVLEQSDSDSYHWMAVDSLSLVGLFILFDPDQARVLEKERGPIILTQSKHVILLMIYPWGPANIAALSPLLFHYFWITIAIITNGGVLWFICVNRSHLFTSTFDG